MMEAASGSAKVRLSPEHKTEGTKLELKRYFTKEGENPYEAVEWELRDVVINDYATGEIVFQQSNIEVPVFWSQTAATIVASKYFRGHGEDREHSVKQLIDRVATSIAKAGLEGRYFDETGAKVLEDELRFLCLHQMMAFNSPVWFNAGTVADPQCSACFILDVEDDMASILNWITEEGLVFRKGSGAGVNISKLREKNAKLSGGGHASGPLSFAMSADRSAGAIKSGGKTRRAAKMLVMDVNHPDIEDFINTKVEGEKVARALIAGGFSSAFNAEGGAYELAPWQNANNSVRVTDDFMEAAINGTEYALTSRVDGAPVRMANASDLWRKIAEAAWDCGDPGLQYHDIVNKWHTCPEDGDIVASNPCSEYMFLNNTACNLASLNLMKFRHADGTFNVETFSKAVETTILAQEIIVSMSSYPTETITKEAKKYRTLGIGFANLGALLMSLGLAYDSDEGRDLAGAISSLMTATSYRMSGDIANAVGTFSGFFRNQKHVVRVLEQHQDAHAKHGSSSLFTGLCETAAKEWEAAVDYAKTTGIRNAQASVLAPTGTISFMMDCDTTGVEPDLALVKYKKLVGGGTIKIVNKTVEQALTKLGYATGEVDDIISYIDDNDTIEGAPGLKPEHLSVFDCSLTPANGVRSIQPSGHVDMMAACQPFLSGAISKTVNLPRSATVEDVQNVYTDAWRKGLKAIAVYRDGCKESQPLNVKTDEEEKTEARTITEVKTVSRERERLPDDRMAGVHKFSISGHDGYMTLGYYPDGRLGEVFVNMAKQGSTLNGLMDAWATMVSLGIQYGIPLDSIIDKFKHTTFEPSGFTGNPDVRMTSSILDYVVRVLETRAQVETSGGLKTAPTEEENVEAVAASSSEKEELVSGPPCSNCGAMTVRSGACYCCKQCGNTTGCG